MPKTETTKPATSETTKPATNPAAAACQTGWGVLAGPLDVEPFIRHRVSKLALTAAKPEKYPSKIAVALNKAGAAIAPPPAGEPYWTGPTVSAYFGPCFK